MSDYRIDIASEAELAELAGEMAACLGVGDCVLLRGDLGTGKTSFARAFIRRRCGESVEVTSPTFLLVQEYEDAAGTTLYHYDLYRLKHPEELWELGLEEMLTQGIALVEWPDRITFDWPEDRVEMCLAVVSGSHSARSLVVSLHGNVVGKLKDVLQHWQEKSRP